MEQVAPLAEADLPPLSRPQQEAMKAIRAHGGTYLRSGAGDWLPPHGDRLSPAARKHFRLTDRTITSLIRNSYLAVAQEQEGKPVMVRLTFP